MRKRILDLEEETRHLRENRRNDLWTIQGLLSMMESMEMSLRLLQDRVATVPVPTVDLTVREEEVSPVLGGPLELGMFSNVPALS